jgi:hypothetical protein
MLFDTPNDTTGKGASLIHILFFHIVPPNHLILGNKKCAFPKAKGTSEAVRHAHDSLFIYRISITR